jgi:hypothetical protein
MTVYYKNHTKYVTKYVDKVQELLATELRYPYFGELPEQRQSPDLSPRL